MIADTMTKWCSNNALMKALTEGVWSLKDTDEAANLRKEAARKRQQYKQNARRDREGDV